MELNRSTVVDGLDSRCRHIGLRGDGCVDCRHRFVRGGDRGRKRNGQIIRAFPFSPAPRMRRFTVSFAAGAAYAWLAAAVTVAELPTAPEAKLPDRAVDTLSSP